MTHWLGPKDRPFVRFHLHCTFPSEPTNRSISFSIQNYLPPPKKKKYIYIYIWNEGRGNLTKTWSRHRGVKPPRLNQLFFTSRGLMTRRPKRRAILRIRAFQNSYLDSQSHFWPLNALNRAVPTASSSQSPTSVLMNSPTVPLSILRCSLPTPLFLLPL
jgi:hypothetical protein